MNFDLKKLNNLQRKTRERMLKSLIAIKLEILKNEIRGIDIIEYNATNIKNKTKIMNKFMSFIFNFI